MTKDTVDVRNPDTGGKPSQGKPASTQVWDRLANFPPIAWAIRTFVRRLVRRQLAKPHAPQATIERAAAFGLEATLQGIVQDVVEVLGYTGAMVATYEQGDSLPVRAFYVDPSIATLDEIRRWENEIAEIAKQPVSITDPDIARVFVYDEACKDNLSVLAVTAGGTVTSDELYDLFTPIAPPASKPAVKGIQQALGIQQVIAVPFFLETSADGVLSQELVGNLFAAKRDGISAQDILVLSAFGRQAAAAIGSERRRLQVEITQELTFRVQTSLHNEQKILDWIVKGVVSDLGYVGAMVAPHEADGSLPVYALHIDPNVATEEDVHRWEQELSDVVGKALSITNPDIARVYIHEDSYQDNLSVKAAKVGQPVTSDDLSELFVPIAPPATKPLVKNIQQALGIQQVIAVPFFLDTLAHGKPSRQLIGNLFAATRSRHFKSSEIELLRAFGQQAAAGIRNARLYRKSEERRQAAQMFGKMAFSAATSVHALANHLGVARMHLTLLELLGPEERAKQLKKNPEVLERLNKATNILDTLREPWRQITDDLTDINACLHQAVEKITPLQETETIKIHLSLVDETLYVKTSSDMLTEAFRVLIKNAFEAIQEKETEGAVDIESCLNGSHIEISIQDSGIGIPPENINRVFDIGWSTKKTGMGFGLFWTKDYIEGIGGTISVASVMGKGTTFQIQLPRAAATEEEAYDGK